MHTQASLLAIAPLFLLARADVEFQLDDAPRACRDICRPVADLYRSCEVDLRGDDNDREEDQLEVQCFCTNDSFDVGVITAQCQDCVKQERDNSRNNNNDNNNGDDDDGDDDEDDGDNDNDNDNDNDYNDAWEDINDIVRTCGFSSTSYLASATLSATSITVTATRPTDASQLTTTFTPARETGQSNNNDDNNNNDSNDNDNDNNDNNNNNNNNNINNNNGDNDDNNDRDDNDDNDDNNDDNDNAAGALAPWWLAGAVVAGGLALFA